MSLIRVSSIGGPISFPYFFPLFKISEGSNVFETSSFTLYREDSGGAYTDSWYFLLPQNLDLIFLYNIQIKRIRSLKLKMTEGYMLSFFPSMTFLDSCPRTIDYFLFGMPVNGSKRVSMPNI